MAEFIVRLEKRSDESPRYNYEFRSSDGRGPVEQEYVADPHPMLVRQYCAKIDEIIQEALGPTLITGDPVDELVRHGQSLYNMLFPSLDGSVPDLARKLSELAEPLLVNTNESDIPWELLHDGTEFLGLAHQIGRRKRSGRPVIDGRGIGMVSRALIVGDPTEDLESARREATELADWLRRHDVECELLCGPDATLLNVYNHLESGDYDLLHYCGHLAAPHGTKLIGLRLHNDDLLDSRALQPLARKGGAPPVVFINGCESASRVSDLCSSFMVLGSRLAVGTLYSVEEEAARRFSERFYDDLMSGSTAGAAVRAAREALRPHGVAWTAFVLYGDPATRISTGRTPVQDNKVTQPTPPEFMYRMDSEAGELMDRVIQHAAPHGVVTSMHLLTELLSTDVVIGRMQQNRASAGRQLLAAELLRSVLDIGVATTAPPDGRIEFSDTVETVLAEAEQLAHESGREEITIADLIAAFTAVGGGSARQLLDLFDISLADLAGGEGNLPKSRSTESPEPTPAPVSSPLSVNGQRSSVATDASESAGGLVFDDNGRLRTDHLEPAMVTAIRVAALLASAQRTVISTGMLMYGLGVANNEHFGNLLRAQGQSGITALTQLSLITETRANRFSPRTRQALERAAERTTSGKIQDSTILPELLAEQNSSAWQVLTRLGVDPRLILRGNQSSEFDADD